MPADDQGLRPARPPQVAAGLDGEDDRALVARARHDPDAFATLYRRHVERIHAFAWRRSGSRELAEDVTAATFERAWQRLDTFEWRGGGFTPWLYRIAANELAGHYRKRATSDRAHRNLFLVEPPAGESPLDDEWPAVRLALDGLLPRYQEVITLRYLAGLSAEEAAEALNTSKPVVAVTLHRALRALRRAVEAGGER